MNYLQWLLIVFVVIPSQGYAGDFKKKTTIANEKYAISFDWSDDSKYFIRNEVLNSDGLMHLCIYESDTLEKKKCVLQLKEDKRLIEVGLPTFNIKGIDWSDDKLFIVMGLEESYADIICRLDIPNWTTNKDVEANEDKLTCFDKTGRSPAWDKRTDTLYFEYPEEMQGIGKIKNGDASDIEGEAIQPFVAGDFLWYSKYGEAGIDSTFKMDLKTGKRIRVSNGEDYSISVDSAGRMCFIRDVLVSDKFDFKEAGVYSYSELDDQTKLLYALEDDFDSIKAARVSHNGDKLLIVLRSSTNEQIDVDINGERYFSAGGSIFALMMLSKHDDKVVQGQLMSEKVPDIFNAERRPNDQLIEEETTLLYVLGVILLVVLLISVFYFKRK